MKRNELVSPFSIINKINYRWIQDSKANRKLKLEEENTGEKHYNFSVGRISLR